MPDDVQLREELLRRIRLRRNSIQAYVHQLRPRSARLSTTSVVSSALAAALTAGPGLGGTKFTELMQQIFGLPSSSIVWRVLCLGAAGVSVVAAVSTNLSKSQEAAIRLNAAESCNAELEGLETQVELGQVPLAEAAKLYQQSVVRIPFIHEGEALDSRGHA